MDNVAHALVGAAIGRAVGDSRVPRAGLLGAVAANIPDLAELFTVAPWPRVQHLALHRGITHSLLGVAVETALTALGIVLVARWRARRSALKVQAREAPSALAILALVGAAMASHPIMDWQGSYGLRPFLPWNGTWYFGDFVAIVDPWYWLLPLVALAWGTRRHWLPLAGCLAIWLPATAAVLLLDAPATWMKVGWVVASILTGIGWVHHWMGPARARLAATAAVVLLGTYAAAQAAAGVPVKAELRQTALRRFGPNATWAALTIPGRPFTWERLMAGPDTVAGTGWAVPRHLNLPVVQRSLRDTEGGRAIASFARFLAAEVDSTVAPAAVRFRDVRYSAPGEDGWATITVSAP